MSWLARALIGPCLWAVAFTVVYALHGLGCAWGWPAVQTPIGSLHHVVLMASFFVALLVTGIALRKLPRGEGVKAQVIAAGGWLGFGGTLLTLFPVLGITSCAAG
ncbi:hypothetical protein [Comamonas sp.]